MSGYRLVTESVSALPWDDYMTSPIFLLLSPTLLHYQVFSLFSPCCTIKVVNYICLISTKPTLQDFRQGNQYLAVDSDKSREFADMSLESWHGQVWKESTERSWLHWVTESTLAIGNMV